MNREDITSLVNDLIDSNASQNQFAVSSVAFHKHNGQDSPAFPFTNLSDVPTSYYGNGGSVVVVDTSEKLLKFLPVGTTGQVLTSNGSNAFPTFNTLTLPVIYGGSVTSAGAASTPFPAGWSVSHIATGQYTITHNLGTSSYAITAMCQTGGKQIIYQNLANNSVDIWTFNASGTGTDSSFNFLLSVV